MLRHYKTVDKNIILKNCLKGGRKYTFLVIVYLMTFKTHMTFLFVSLCTTKSYKTLCVIAKETFYCSTLS